MAGKVFPDEYLPRKVLQMRETASVSLAQRTEFVFPSEAKAKAQAAQEATSQLSEDGTAPLPATRKRGPRGK
jgi:hypothetical protein